MLKTYYPNTRVNNENYTMSSGRPIIIINSDETVLLAHETT